MANYAPSLPIGLGPCYISLKDEHFGGHNYDREIPQGRILTIEKVERTNSRYSHYIYFDIVDSQVSIGCDNNTKSGYDARLTIGDFKKAVKGVLELKYASPKVVE